jgi:hypothetical protein
MQWRWFCKFPQRPIPTKRHSLHESRLVPDSISIIGSLPLSA